MAPLVTPISEPYLGGSQAFVAHLAGRLLSRGHCVDVYAAHGSHVAGFVDLGIDAGALNAARRGVDDAWATERMHRALALIRDEMRRRGYDLVHNHAFDAPAVSVLLEGGAPVLHTLHLPPSAAMVEALAARRPKVHAAVVSEHQLRSWSAAGIPVDSMLPCGLPTEVMPFGDMPGDHLLFAGRLSPEKGALQAIAIAQAAGMPLRMFGDPYDASYASCCTAAVYRTAARGVSLSRAQPQALLWEEMSHALAVLCPADWDEPFGLVAAEAQACGAPVIAFDAGALSEVVCDGVTGFVVPRGDVSSAVGALRRIRSLSRQGCRAWAQSQFGLDASVAAHEHAYQRFAAEA